MFQIPFSKEMTLLDYPWHHILPKKSSRRKILTILLFRSIARTQYNAIHQPRSRFFWHPKKYNRFVSLNICNLNFFSFLLPIPANIEASSQVRYECSDNPSLIHTSWAVFENKSARLPPYLRQHFQFLYMYLAEFVKMVTDQKNMFTIFKLIH